MGFCLFFPHIHHSQNIYCLPYLCRSPHTHHSQHTWYSQCHHLPPALSPGFSLSRKGFKALTWATLPGISLPSSFQMPTNTSMFLFASSLPPLKAFLKIIPSFSWSLRLPFQLERMACSTPFTVPPSYPLWMALNSAIPHSQLTPHSSLELLQKLRPLGPLDPSPLGSWSMSKMSSVCSTSGMLFVWVREFRTTANQSSVSSMTALQTAGRMSVSQTPDQLSQQPEHSLTSQRMDLANLFSTYLTYLMGHLKQWLPQPLAWLVIKRWQGMCLKFHIQSSNKWCSRSRSSAEPEMDTSSPMHTIGHHKVQK